MAASNTAAAASIRVVVAGPNGRMGAVMLHGLPEQEGITVIGGLSRADSRDTSDQLLADADVLVDFTHAESAPGLLLRAIDAGVRPVTGTSGLGDDVLDAIDRAARERGIGALWAPHFRLAGVLQFHFARIAARYFDSVEIIEAHHAGKADAPSGAATELAQIIRTAHGSDLLDPPVQNEVVPGVRGGVEGGVRIHSLRLPGILGSHELVFAGDQEILTIRHTDNDRAAYTSNVATAVRKVMEPDVVGLIRGYDSLIGLTE